MSFYSAILENDDLDSGSLNRKRLDDAMEGQRGECKCKFMF